jgi:hypothetical protein
MNTPTNVSAGERSPASPCSDFLDSAIRDALENNAPLKLLCAINRLVAACKAIDAEKWLLDPQCQEDTDMVEEWRSAYKHFLPNKQIIAPGKEN